MSTTPEGGPSPRVASAVARLDELTPLPGAEQVPVYEDVIRRLHDALAESG